MAGTRSPAAGHRKMVYENKYQQIYQVTVDFGSFAKEYFVTDYGARAGVLVIKDGSVLLVRQYRLQIDRMSWEIPGGKVEEGEMPETSAMRECLEETGMQCRNLKPLLFFHPGLDTLHNPTHLFYTTDLTEIPDVKIDPDEIEQHVWIPFQRCIEMVFTQQIIDSLTIVALLTYNTLISKNSPENL